MSTTTIDAVAVGNAREEIENAEETFGAWFAEKLDISADEFFKEIGKWGGRLAVAGLGAGALWLFDVLEKLGPLIEILKRVISTAIS